MIESAEEYLRNYEAYGGTAPESGAAHEQQDTPVQGADVPSNRSTQCVAGFSTNQAMLDEHAALLALSRARLAEQVAGLPSAMFMDSRVIQQQHIASQQLPYPLSSSLYPAMSQLGRPAMGLNLPNLPENQRRLLPSPFPPAPSSQHQAYTNLLLDQLAGNPTGLGGGQQLTEDEIQRLLRNRYGPAGEGKHGF